MTRHDDPARNAGLLAVLRRCPASAPEIERMIRADDEFRSMCDDLAAVDGAQALLGELPERLRAERCAEYEGLARDLMAEIEAAVLRAKVVPLPGARQGPKK